MSVFSNEFIEFNNIKSVLIIAEIMKKNIEKYLIIEIPCLISLTRGGLLLLLLVFLT